MVETRPNSGLRAVIRPCDPGLPEA